MTPEEKELLIKDLCGRLPYGVMCKGGERARKVVYVKPYQLYAIGLDNGEYISQEYTIEDVKPYLRPMSSMTEEERKEVEELIKSHKPLSDGIINNKGMDNLLFSVSITSGYLIDWLNKKMFDHNGLIPIGLAIEAPEGMYNS